MQLTSQKGKPAHEKLYPSESTGERREEVSKLHTKKSVYSGTIIFKLAWSIYCFMEENILAPFNQNIVKHVTCFTLPEYRLNMLQIPVIA